MASSRNDNVTVTSQIISAIHSAKKAIEESATATTDIALSIRDKNDHTMINKLAEAMMQFAKYDCQLEEWIKVIDRNRDNLTKYSQPQNDADDQQQADPHQDMHQSIHEECQQSCDNITDSQISAHQFIRNYQDATRFIVGDDMADDIVATQSQKSTKCPITQKEMEDPVKSKLCNHTYSRYGILQHIENRSKNNRQAICPVGGCQQSVKETDLVPDEQMAALIQSNQN